MNSMLRAAKKIVTGHGRGAGVCIQGVLPSAGKAFRSTRSAILASQGIDKHDAPEIGAVWRFSFRSFSGSGSSADKNKLVSSFTPMQDKINGEEIAEENTTDDGAERGPARESAKTPDGSRSYDRVNENGEAFVKLAPQECFSNTVLICLTYKHGTLLAADGSLFFQSEQCLIKDDHCKIWNVNERVWLAFAGWLQVKNRASSFLVRDFHHLSTAAAVARVLVVYLDLLDIWRTTSTSSLWTPRSASSSASSQKRGWELCELKLEQRDPLAVPSWTGSTRRTRAETSRTPSSRMHLHCAGKESRRATSLAGPASSSRS